MSTEWRFRLCRSFFFFLVLLIEEWMATGWQEDVIKVGTTCQNGERSLLSMLTDTFNSLSKPASKDSELSIESAEGR
jgi:hypothetical protein